MLDWQTDVVRERDALVTRLYATRVSYNDSLKHICEHAELVYHMTKYLQSLDREIASWKS